MTSNMTMMGVNDTNFMVMERDQQNRIDYDDYVIPSDAMNSMELIMNGNAKMTDDMLQKLDNKTVNETRQSVLYNLAMSYEATLIIEAAQALGDRGIMGMDFPSAMSFYQFALRLSILRDISESGTEPYVVLMVPHAQVICAHFDRAVTIALACAEKVAPAGDSSVETAV